MSVHDAQVYEAGAELAEVIKTHKASLIGTLTRRQLEELTSALHEWNLAAIAKQRGEQ